MRQSTIDKIYKKFRNKYPDIKNEGQIEILVRKYILKRKLLIAFFLFALSLLLFLFVLNNISVFFKNLSHDIVDSIYNYTIILGASSMIAAIMVFVKTMYDPLTPNESKELQERETFEKTDHK